MEIADPVVKGGLSKRSSGLALKLIGHSLFETGRRLSPSSQHPFEAEGRLHHRHSFPNLTGEARLVGPTRGGGVWIWELGAGEELLPEA